MARAREMMFYAAALAVAAMVGLGVYVANRPNSDASTPTTAVRVGARTIAPPTTTPVATIVDAARQLKLVTYTFRTDVDAQVLSDRWYGDANARVRAPVRYQYGIDLATLKADDVFYDAAGRRYVFVVQPPTRIAAEVDLAEMQSALSVSGLRWKSQNQEKLDQARALLAERAQAMTLTPADQQRIVEASREQLETLLRKILAQRGEETVVSVRFGK